MTTEAKSVRLPEGTLAVIEGFVAEDRLSDREITANKILAKFIKEGIERRLNPPPVVDQEELERFRQEVGNLRLAMKELRKEAAEGEASLKAELATAKRQLDDQEMHLLEVEHEKNKALETAAAAERLLEELDVQKLSGALEAAEMRAATEAAKVTELDQQLATVTKERDEERAKPVEVTQGTTQKEYDVLLRKAHTMAGHLKNAVFLPPGLVRSLEDYASRGAMTWRMQACWVLVDGMEKKGINVPAGWASEIPSKLPLLPELPSR